MTKHINSQKNCRNLGAIPETCKYTAQLSTESNQIPDVQLHLLQCTLPTVHCPLMTCTVQH